MTESKRNPSIGRFYAAALIAVVATAAAAGPPAPAGFKLGGDPARGRAAFAKRCAVCHGEKGDAKSGAAAGLLPKPADLTDRKVMARRSDWDLYRVIKDGGPAIGLSSTMMGWAQVMPDPEIRDTAAYVRSLAKK